MKLFDRITSFFRPWTPPAAETPPSGAAGLAPDDRVPLELTGVISQEAYTWVVAQTLRHFRKGKFIFRLDGGLLFYTPAESPVWRQLNLTHLVQQLVCEDRSLWIDRIADCIDLHRADQVALEGLLESFDAAKDKLTVRLHSRSTYERFPIEGYLLKTIIPELYAALALELPGQFHILQRSEINHWGIDEDELLWTAYGNLADQREKIQVVEQEGEGFTVVTLLDKDYAAAFALDFANHCAEWIGKVGSMIALPSKGCVFIYPIAETVAFNAAFTKMADLVNRYYREGHSPLSNDLYWFHHNRFERFPKAMEGHTLTYSIPSRLLAYLRTPLAHPAFVSDVKDSLLEGFWEGYYEYGQGFRAPLFGSRREFQLTLRSKSGQLEGSSVDEDHAGQASVWGFVDRELISFIKKFPDRPAQDIHFTGFFDAGEVSFTGTWVIDEGNGKIFSGSWAMVKL